MKGNSHVRFGERGGETRRPQGRKVRSAPTLRSGVMLLAGARQFPAWAAQAGLVQLYGMDIDQTCVTMAQVNMMLYGLNGAGLHSALTATPRQLASLPEPFQQAYTLAQEAQASRRRRPGRGDRRHAARAAGPFRR